LPWILCRGRGPSTYFVTPGARQRHRLDALRPDADAIVQRAEVLRQELTAIDRVFMEIL